MWAEAGSGIAGADGGAQTVSRLKIPRAFDVALRSTCRRNLDTKAGRKQLAVEKGGPLHAASDLF